MTGRQFSEEETTNPTRPVDAIVFDLDGVLTDTAEYHFQAWKRLADEEGIPFTRQDNEKLRGVSRRKSLELLLDGRQVSEAQAQEMMARKNDYYRDLLQNVTPDDLLPGAAELLAEIHAAGLKIAIASASRNARDVVSRLGLEERIDALADGYSPARPKPAPDLFLHAARLLDVRPTQCIVVEDAKAGVEAGIAAGMVTVGVGPPERVGAADLVLPDLDGARLAVLTRAATWRVSEATFEPAQQHHYETVLAQGNGYLGTRATFEEGYPGDRQATLVHGLWDDVPLAFTELANAPDWTALDVVVDGQRFDMTCGTISDYARYLELRTGVLHRRVRWRPAEDGPEVDLTFERFPSLADPHLLGGRVRVEPLSGTISVELRARLDGGVENPGFLHEGITHWDLIEQAVQPDEASLLVRARHTRKSLAMCARLDTQPTGAEQGASGCPGGPALTRTATVKAGQALVVDKFVAVYTSRDTDDPLAAAQENVRTASELSYEALRAASDTTWADFWRDSDVVIEGDDEAQLAIRHALFQLRAAASQKDEKASVGAKALSGFGYRGHVFWDTEIYVLPFFTFTQPQLARNLLMYRWHTLDGARRKAAGNGYAGAQYAWESAETGDEVTPPWLPDLNDPSRLIRVWTGDIELHITADVAYAIWQYWRVTGDDDFMREVGAPIILETAVFWGERAEPENGRYAIRGVIGPDEYHDHVDNNVYTNRLAQWHLERALEVHVWLHQIAPDQAVALDQRLDLTPARLDHWRHIVDNLTLLQDPESGLMEQFEGFFELEDLDWSQYADRTVSIQSLLGIEGTNRAQALKQPDVLLLLCLLREEYAQQAWGANWDYYAPRTDHRRGSSLGPPTHAWAACEVGRSEEAYEHFMRAARVDLHNVRANVMDGVHAASAGGLWQALAFGFAGLRLTDEGYTLRPRLPAHWTRLAFSFYLKGERQAVDLRAKESVKEED